ncbi:GIY-YIG nuclease family protein [Georgenia thermotolerans]|uniref:GIY-YIG nuclease family protein n=1 Tax=Georgenia thermotolerans TaxID=527326 RepID=UPI0012657481|nr:GIY-YIG nuclease family protein [Georgenia thermotolerans]
MNHRDPSLREHYVYRFYDADGALLYIGCTVDPRMRWKEHKSFRREMTDRVAKVRMQGPYNYDTARAIEKQAIKDEHPTENVIYNRPAGFIAEKRRRSRFVEAEMVRLMDLGLGMAEALKVADAAYDKRVAA